MTLHQLKVFSQVAKLRSFTLAAASLDVSQPSVSFVIQNLERELGTKLFEKLGNKIHLTGAGEKLLHHAVEIVAKVEEIRGEMDELKELKKGKIKVGGTAVAAASFLLPLIQAFKREHKDVDVALRIQLGDFLERALLEGEIDVAFLRRPPHSPLLAAQTYREEEVVVIAPPNHPLTKRGSVPLELIAKEPLILHDGKGRYSLIRGLVEREFAKKRLPFVPALEIAVEFGSRDVIRNAVADGQGIGFLSAPHVLSDVRAGRLKVLRVPELQLTQKIYIASHKNRQAGLARAFIVLAKKFRRIYKAGKTRGRGHEA